MPPPRQTRLRLPPPPPAPGRAARLRLWLACGLLALPCWLLAHRWRTPGLRFHLDSLSLGLQLLRRAPHPRPAGLIFRLLFFPMDSTRYFELDFMWRAAGPPTRGVRSALPAGRYLDVSSPRLLPLLLLRHGCVHSADLLNPDTRDLADTAAVVRAAGLDGRCRLHDCRLEAAAFAPASFDLITSLSVIEHIPDGRATVERLWALLRPGGRLLVSVPCAAQAVEQYLDRNPYGLLAPDDQGFIFWQRLYDPELLRAHLFDVAGPPRSAAVYGERRAGFLERNAQQKRSDPLYPLWREACLVGREFALFPDVASLPGEGVIAMEFVKP